MGALILTKREHEVIYWLYRAFKRPEIAKEMKVTENRVKHLITSIANKLDIDREKYHLQIRIVYLLSHQRRLQ